MDTVPIVDDVANVNRATSDEYALIRIQNLSDTMALFVESTDRPRAVIPPSRPWWRRLFAPSSYTRIVSTRNTGLFIRPEIMRDKEGVTVK
jgi:hypothetical protein